MGNKNDHPARKVKHFQYFQKHIEQKNIFNIHLFGDTCTGKTCLVHLYKNGVYRDTGKTCFCHTYENEVFQGYSSIERHFSGKGLTMQNMTTKLRIWDHPGSHRFRSILPVYMPGADGIFLLYSVTDIQTFLELPEWLKTVRKLNSEAIIFIIGALSDLFEGREVSRETGLKFARKENLEFFECSAKTGENVNYVFEHMALRLLQKKGVKPFDKTEIGKYDKIEIKGKSLERKEPGEKLNTSIKDEMLQASITEKKEPSTSLTREEILESEQNIVPVEDTPKILNEGKVLSEMKMHCLALKNVDDINITKRDNITSFHLNKESSSEVNELGRSSDDTKNVISEAKKSVLSEEEMQLEGKCPPSLS